MRQHHFNGKVNVIEETYVNMNYVNWLIMKQNGILGEKIYSKRTYSFYVRQLHSLVIANECIIHQIVWCELNHFEVMILKFPIGSHMKWLTNSVQLIWICNCVICAHAFVHSKSHYWFYTWQLFVITFCCGSATQCIVVRVLKHVRFQMERGYIVKMWGTVSRFN